VAPLLPLGSHEKKKESQKKQTKTNVLDFSKKQESCAILILAVSSSSARRAVHLWPIFSLREHQRAFLGFPRKSGVLQGSLYLSRESLGNSIFPLFGENKEEA
jgi:hypothetical protein